MDPVTAYDVPPPRPGAAPTLDTVATGTVPRVNLSPQWNLLTPALVRILRAHFSVQSRIEDPDLIARIWTADESSPIVITSAAEWKPENSNERPAILVDRLEQNRMLDKRAIGDQFQGARPGSFAFLMQGAHVVHVVGGREGEAEKLAKECWRELSRFAPFIGPKLCLLRLLPMSIGKRVELTEHKQIYAVPIPITYGYWEQFRITPTDESEITGIVTSLQTSTGF